MGCRIGGTPDRCEGVALRRRRKRTDVPGALLTKDHHVQQ